MKNATGLNNFLKKIMSIDVLSMGGAMAGIIGASPASTPVVYELKHVALDYAKQYQARAADAEQLRALQDKIIGMLNTLQLSSTLSHETAQNLIDEVLALTESA